MYTNLQGPTHCYVTKLEKLWTLPVNTDTSFFLIIGIVILHRNSLTQENDNNVYVLRIRFYIYEMKCNMISTSVSLLLWRCNILTSLMFINDTGKILNSCIEILLLFYIIDDQSRTSCVAAMRQHNDLSHKAVTWLSKLLMARNSDILL